jgi:IclR family transcriptional regulator, acetate operon repressor
VVRSPSVYGNQSGFHTVKGSPALARTYSVVAVDRAVSILGVFDGRPARSLAEIGRATALSEATVLRYLSSLGRHGLVERDEVSGQYRLGLRLFQLGQQALVDRDPRQIGLPLMKGLLERFGETVNLAMRHGDAIVIIEVIEGTRSIKKGATIGEQDFWHASALGKSILAFLPEEESRGILERRGTPPATPTTLTTFEQLSRAFERVRRFGYAVDDEEAEEGLRCVGAPIFDQRGRPGFALSLSGPAYRFTAQVVGEMGEEVRSAAASISAKLGYADGGEKGASSGRRA